MQGNGKVTAEMGGAKRDLRTSGDGENGRKSYNREQGGRKTTILERSPKHVDICLFIYSLLILRSIFLLKRYFLNVANV